MNVSIKIHPPVPSPPLNHSPPHRLGNGLGAGIDVKLSVNIMEMKSHGVDADKELVGDCLVTVSLNKGFEKFSLAWREWC